MIIFKLSDEILKSKTTSKQVAYFLVSITFMNLTLSHLHTVTQLGNTNLSQLKQLYDWFRFIEIQGLLALGSSYLEIILLLLFTLVSLLFTQVAVAAFHLRNWPHQDVTITFYGKIVIIGKDLFIWGLFEPICITFWSTISCNPDLFSQTQIICDTSQTKYLNLMLLSILGLAFTLPLLFLIPLFLISNPYNKKDFLSSGNAFSVFTFTISRFFVTLLMTLRLSGNVYLLIYLTALLAIYQWHVVDAIRGRGQELFAARALQSLYFSLISGIAGMMIGFIIEALHQLSQSGDVPSSEGSIIIVFVSTVLWVTLMRFLRERRKIKSLHSPLNSNPEDFEAKISAFQDLLSSRSSANRVKYIGLIINHFETLCLDQRSRCFCQSERVYFGKKQKDYKLGIISIISNKSVFGKFLIKSWYESYLYLNPNQHLIRVKYARFLYFSLGAHCTALEQLKIASPHIVNPIQQCGIYKLIQSMKRELAERNHQSFKASLDFENVLLGEQTIHLIYKNIIKILDDQSKFWRLVQDSNIYEQDLIEINGSIQKRISKCQELWHQLRRFKSESTQEECNLISKRQKWIYLYSWFRLNILNKTLKKAEIDTVLENDTLQDIVNEDSASDNDDQPAEAFSKNKPFSLQSAIFHTHMNGKIVGFSQCCKEIFGFSFFSHLKQIQPVLVQRNHERAVEEFIQTGKRRSLYTRKKVYCKHQQGYIIEAKKYLKWYVSTSNSINFICMIRPILRVTAMNFLLLNEEWELETGTQQILTLFLKYFQGDFNKVCLFLLCPKLLHFTKYAGYMTENDFAAFKLKHAINPVDNGVLLTDTNFSNGHLKTLVPQVRADQGSIVIDTTKRESYLSPETMENSPVLLSNALLDEFHEDNNNRYFHKMVDESHVKMVLRIPKLIHNMAQEYKEMKKTNFEDTFLACNLYKSAQRLIFRNQRGKLKFRRALLLKQLRILKQEYDKKMLVSFKQLFTRYCARARLLENIIKCDATIKFTKAVTFDKTIIIKINKLEIVDKNSMQSKAEIGMRPVTAIRVPPETHHYFPEVVDNLNSNNISEVESHKTQPVKLLMTENQIKCDFTSEKRVDFDLNSESNIFVKEENNKPSKSLIEMSMYLLLNRCLWITVFIVNISTLLVGPTLNSNERLLQISEYTRAILETNMILVHTYEAIIDVLLINEHPDLILEILEDMSDIRTVEEFYEHQAEHASEFNALSLEIHSTSSFIKIFYDKRINQDDSNKILDYFSMFKVNLVMEKNAFYKNIRSNSPIVLNYRRISIPNLKNFYSENMDDAISYIKQIYLTTQQTIAVIIVISACLLIFLILGIFYYVNKLIIKNQVFSSLQQFTLKYSILKKTGLHKYVPTSIKLRSRSSFFTCPMSSTNYVLLSLDEGNMVSQQFLKMASENFEKDRSALPKQKGEGYVASKVWSRLRVRVWKNQIKLFMLHSVICILTLLCSLYFCVHLLQFSTHQIEHIEGNPYIYQTNQFWVVLALKELYIYDQKQTKELNQTALLSILETFQQQSKGVNPILYQTTHEGVERIFYGDQCVDADSEFCAKLLNGAMKRGLRQFNYQLLLLVEAYLQGDASRFEEYSLKKVFEFSQLNDLATDKILEAFEIWEAAFDDDIQKQEVNQVIILATILSFTTLIHFLGFELYAKRATYKVLFDGRQYYKSYYPNEVVNLQKMIRAQLVKIGVIQK